MPKAVIIMGSKSDLSHGQKIAEKLGLFGIETAMRVSSAHKIPDHTLKLLEQYNSEQDIIFIAIAGRSNALGGLLDANTNHVVINCPPYSDKYGGADIFSSLRMPSGLAAPVVLEPEQAALTCAKIFAMKDPTIKEKLTKYKAEVREKLIQTDKELNK